MTYIWINDGVIEKQATHEEALKYFSYDWVGGRLRNSCKRCGKRFNKHHCKNHESRCHKLLLRRLNVHNKNKHE